MTRPVWTPEEEQLGLFADPDAPPEQGALFAHQDESVREAKRTVVCPTCGDTFTLHPTVARTFHGCSRCREAGLWAPSLLVAEHEPRA